MNVRLTTICSDLNSEALKDCTAFQSNASAVKSYEYSGSRIEKQIGVDCLKQLQTLFGKGDYEGAD